MPFEPAIVEPKGNEELMKMVGAVKSRSGTIFERHVVNRPLDKMRVAYCIARRCGAILDGAFVSDGSSTYYVGVALAQMMKSGDDHYLRTNNLSMCAELGRTGYPRSLELQLIEGTVDHDLGATFPRQDRSLTQLFGNDTLQAICSVSELHFDQGPAAPNAPTKLLKKCLLRHSDKVIIPLDWRKLASRELNNPVMSANDWAAIRDSLSIVIVCAKPNEYGENDWVEIQRILTDNAISKDNGNFVFGEELAASFRPGSADWNVDSVEAKFKRYCWNVYNFGNRDNITFIEVGP